MKKLCCAVILGWLLLPAQQVSAQDKTKDDVKKLENDLAKLRVQVSDLQGRLQKAKEAEAKPGKEATTKHWKHPGFAWMHFAKMHAGHKGACAGKTGHHHGGWAHHGWHGTHWAHHGGWAGHHFAMHMGRHHGWHHHHHGSGTVEQRLNLIQHELEALRQQLQKSK